MVKFLKSCENRYQLLIGLILGVIALTCLFPLLYVLGMSFTSEAELLENNNFVIIPMKPILTAYQYVFGQDLLWNSFKITVLRTVFATVVAMLSAFLTGYVLAEVRLPFRRAIMIFFIITMLLGGGLIPTYLLYSKMKLLNSFWVYILPAVVNTYGMMVLKIFIENLPKELMDSSELDGAGNFAKMFQIILPLTLPSIAAIALFNAVGQWNSWFDAMVYVNRDASLYPMALIVRNLLTSGSLSQSGSDASTSVITTPMGVRMASVVISIVPILCLYPFLQKYFVYGMFMGAVKE